MAKKIYKVKSYGKEYNVFLKKSKYTNNGKLALALFMESGEPFSMLSINLEDSNKLTDELCYIDTNNCPWAEEFITSNDLGFFMFEKAQSGFCTYPLYCIY